MSFLRSSYFIKAAGDVSVTSTLTTLDVSTYEPAPHEVAVVEDVDCPTFWKLKPGSHVKYFCEPYMVFEHEAETGTIEYPVRGEVVALNDGKNDLSFFTGYSRHDGEQLIYFGLRYYFWRKKEGQE